MAEVKEKYGLDPKWDEPLDAGVRRIVYCTFTGFWAGRFLFRSPATRWATFALGAIVGTGTAHELVSERAKSFESSVILTLSVSKDGEE